MAERITLIVVTVVAVMFGIIHEARTDVPSQAYKPIAGESDGGKSWIWVVSDSGKVWTCLIKSSDIGSSAAPTCGAAGSLH